MSNLRVCIVSPLFHPNTGGPGRQAYTMAAILKDKCAGLIVIARQLNIDIPKLEGIEIYFVRTPRPERYNLSEFTFLNLLISLSFSFGVIFRLFLLREKYDIVQFYGAGLSLLVCLPLLKLLKKNVVVKIAGAQAHLGMEIGSLRGTFLEPVLVRIFLLVDKIIVMSDELRDRVIQEKFSPMSVVKISNGVDVQLFYPYSQKEREQLRKKTELSNKKVFVYSGWLIERKGLDILLEAVALVAEKEKTAYLFLLGDGPMNSELKKKADSLGLSGKVCFKGNVSNVQDFLNMADLFVFPSFREGMPNSLLEAMACGLPVIASRIGGIVDLVEDGKSGILFEPGDVSGLASAIIKLLNDNGLRQRLGAEARKRIEEGFSIERVAEEYINLYKELAIHPNKL